MCFGSNWKALLPIYLSFLHASQNESIQTVLCSLGCKWDLLTSSFFSFTLLAKVLVIRCEVVVGYFVVSFNNPFIFEITSWTTVN